MEEKKLGLKSVISVSVGLVIATSCLVSLGQGAGTIGAVSYTHLTLPTKA